MNFDPRENWRIVLLVVMLLASGVLLFVPGIGLGATNAPAGDGGGLVSTNLQFGLDLSGGTRVRAPLVGLTATGVDAGGANVSTVQENVAGRLDNVSEGDVVFFTRVNDERAPALEVRANVSESAFRAALDGAGVEYGGIQPGVTQETRQQAVRVIRSKIDESGLADRTVQSSFSAGDSRYYVLIEVPNQNRSQVLDLVNTRGSVRIDAYHSTQQGNETVWTNRTVLEQGDFRNIGIAQRDEQNGPHIDVSIKDGKADEFQQDMVETGVAQRTSTVCGWPGDPEFEQPPPAGADGTRGPCLLTVVDGEVVYSAGMDGGLGGDMVDESWASDPRFLLQTNNLSEARDLSINLRAGQLPTTLNVDAGTTSFVAPSLAENFKLFSLITGIIAVLAVAATVFLRYGDPRVAAPMVVTALSEVFILLGFASAVGLALDLSHVAGFIAVIGTGVDDLIIIADEVLSEGEVGGGRVFQSRFRKAFWVIGAAAATTIIAMSPLAFLQLGDLRGFAIVTILGVLIGILVTRPAYGDILRNLMTRS
jgi:preprotein translocase subunit SecD